eukprot:6098049-Prymnesium_polylepis.1
MRGRDERKNPQHNVCTQHAISWGGTSGLRDTPIDRKTEIEREGEIGEVGRPRIWAIIVQQRALPTEKFRSAANNVCP